MFCGFLLNVLVIDNRIYVRVFLLRFGCGKFQTQQKS